MTPQRIADWVDKDLAMNAWTTLQIHGIGDPSTGFEPIPTQHIYRSSGLREERGRQRVMGGAVSAKLQLTSAHRRLWKPALPQAVAGETKFTWQVPTPFPARSGSEGGGEGFQCASLSGRTRTAPEQRRGVFGFVRFTRVGCERSTVKKLCVLLPAKDEAVGIAKTLKSILQAGVAAVRRLRHRRWFQRRYWRHCPHVRRERGEKPQEHRQSSQPCASGCSLRFDVHVTTTSA